MIWAFLGLIKNLGRRGTHVHKHTLSQLWNHRTWNASRSCSFLERQVCLPSKPRSYNPRMFHIRESEIHEENKSIQEVLHYSHCSAANYYRVSHSTSSLSGLWNHAAGEDWVCSGESQIYSLSSRLLSPPLFIWVLCVQGQLNSLCLLLLIS